MSRRELGGVTNSEPFFSETLNPSPFKIAVDSLTGIATPRVRSMSLSRSSTTGSSGVFPAMSSGDAIHSRSGTLSLSTATNRPTARRAKFGSTPRSNRFEASLRSPCRFEERAIDMGSKKAASTSTSVVDSEISLEAPPMIPARPRTWSSPSTMTQSSPVSPRPRPAFASSRTTPSRVSSVSPLRALRARSVFPATCAAS